MNSVRVSVILPSLNVGGYIDEAIASVRQQALEDIEIMCIDAGSTDGTREKIAKHANEDNRIVVIDSSVKSYGIQVNMGIDLARGEYIAVLETDDYVDPDMYGNLYDIACEQSLDYVKCDYYTYTVDEKGDRMFSTRGVGREQELYESLFVPSEHPGIAFDDWYLWNGIYRTEFLRVNNIRFSETPGAAFQDIGFLHRTTSRARSARYLAQPLYKYCVSRPEASSKSDRTLLFIRQEYGLIFDEIGDKGEPEEYALLYRRLAKSFARACMDSSDGFLEGNDAKEIIGWFRARLLIGEREGHISADIIPSGLRDTYRHLVPADDYIFYRRKRVREISEFIGKGHPVVIFGCGMYGQEALEYIGKLGFNADCFMDNSENKWGRRVAGHVVNNPRMISEMPGDTRYIVANENHADEIISQIATLVDCNMIMAY